MLPERSVEQAIEWNLPALLNLTVCMMQSICCFTRSALGGNTLTVFTPHGQKISGVAKAAQVRASTLWGPPISGKYHNTRDRLVKNYMKPARNGGLHRFQILNVP